MRTPPNPQPFYDLVWAIVKQIPEGQVSTYGQIASMIPEPPNVSPESYKRLGAQWVGTAMNNTPSGEGIPWQRVINSKGMVSISGTTGDKQRVLLENEDVAFDANGAVDFNKVGWDGPDEAWLKAHGLGSPTPLKKKKNNGKNDDATQMQLL